MRCNPETTPPWEPIAAALTRARNGPAEPESIGRADGGGRGRVRIGEHERARVRPLTWVHGHEVYAREVHAYEVHTHEVYAMRYTAMRCTPMRYTAMRCTPMRYTTMRCTTMRYMLMR